MNKIILAFLFVVTVFLVFGQKKETRSITENELKAHVEFLASDYMQGRDFGTSIPGLEITAEYIKSECLKMGLKAPLLDYTQQLELVSIKIDKEKSKLKLKNKEGETIYSTSDICSFAGTEKSDTINGSIVFAGFGFHDTKTSYNDFEGIELTDKIVLVMTGKPELNAAESENKNLTNLEMSKLGRIFLSGARAVIFIPNPLNTDNTWFEMVKDFAAQGSWHVKEMEQNRFAGGNIILGNVELADALLAEKVQTLKEIQQEINSSGNPNSFAVNNSSIEILFSKKKELVSGENIVGYVEGSDPVLKDECIVLTAHYDHVGVNGSGEINNGADDNASGTSALLEIAEAFSQMKKKPRRSIVFAWVTAEEKGLLGAEYYTMNPVFPIENTVANINLDMVGRVAEMETTDFTNPERSLAGQNGIHIISGQQSSELLSISYDISNDLGLIPYDDLSNEFLSGSDHFSFYKKGIPVVAFTTGLHEDYHYPGDDVEKINYHKVKRIADLTFLVSYEIANRKNRIVVDNPKK